MFVPTPKVTEKTLTLERYRAVVMGIFESAQGMFILLILVRWFHGSPADKSMVAAADKMGLLIAPLVLFAQRFAKVSAPRSMATLFFLSACAMGAAGMVASKTSFALLATLSVLLASGATPLLTSVYSTNVPAPVRGRHFGRNSAIRVGTSMAFATLAGAALSGRLHLFPWLLGVYAVSLFVAGVLANAVPMVQTETRSPPLLECFSYLRSDPILRETTIAWMLLGFGNLMMIPLRIEYLANPIYGLKLSEVEIALVVSTVPNFSRLIGTALWGRAFDAMNFFTLRMVLNVSFAVGTLAFFASGSWSFLVCSAAVLGFVNAGGDVAWNLWVTKFAPAERVPDYMAVHTFFTGFRGVVAPATGFFLLQHLQLQTLSWLSASLMFSSLLVLARARKKT